MFTGTGTGKPNIRITILRCNEDEKVLSVTIVPSNRSPVSLFILFEQLLSH